MSSKNDFDSMDDLINLINNISPPNDKTPKTNSIATPPNNIISNPTTNTQSDEETDTDDDQDVSYLLHIINANKTDTTKPQIPIKSTKSTKNGTTHVPTLHTNTTDDTNTNTNTNSHSISFIPDTNTNNNFQPNSSLDDLINLLSPSKPKPKHIQTQIINDPNHKNTQNTQKPPSPPTLSDTTTNTPSPPPKSTITVSIRTLTNEVMTYEMQPNDTVKMIKNNIYTDHKIWPSHQRLIYGGDNLVEKHRLNMLGIGNDAILYMVLTTICSNTEPPKKIAIQKLNGDVFYISCTSDDTVQALKRTICNQEGYEIESQILYFRYNKLENTHTLAQYNIQNNSLLKMMVRNTRFDNYKDDEEDDGDEVEEEEVKLKPFSPQNEPNSNAPIPAPDAVIKKAISLPSVPPVNDIKSAPIAPILPSLKQVKPPPPPQPPVALPLPLPLPLHPLEPIKDDKKTQLPEAKGDISGAPDLPPALAVTATERKGYNGWNIGDICYRKNEKCSIKSIDFNTNPPTLIITLLSEPKREINTEFHLISTHPPPPPPIKPKQLPEIPQKPEHVPKPPQPPPPPPPNNNNRAIVPTPPNRPSKPKRIHLCSPSLINQLMAVNTIKYIGSGLKNLGNSCYMNATLQCLTYTQVFQNYIYQKIHTRTCNTKHKNKVCFMCELHHFLPQIINNGGYVLSPTRLFTNLPYLSSSLVPGRQEDSHELWTALIKQLQSAVIPASNERNGKKLAIAIQETSIIYKIWGGYLRSQILCTVCNKGSNTYDSIVDLSLEIRGCTNIVSALKKFTMKEKLDGDNKYFCQYCGVKQNAIKQLTIFDAPNILVLHLKRFEFGTKIDKFVAFGMNLDLTPFMSRYGRYKQRNMKVMYRLYAVLIHAGKYSNCGHYFSYVRTANDKWYLCNDASVRSSSVGNVLKQCGYMFFYQRCSKKSYHTY